MEKAADKVTRDDKITCGNCGRRIQSNQQSMAIYNTRYKTYEHYHESYLGCYESTRESSKPKRLTNRFQPWLIPLLKDEYETPTGGQNIWSE